MDNKSPIKQAAAKQDVPTQSNDAGADVEAALDNTQFYRQDKYKYFLSAA